MNTKRKTYFSAVAVAFTALVLIAASFVFSTPASAQVLYFTPTADSSGAIYYVVKEGDTCDSVSLVNNIPVDTLRELNGLDFDKCRFLQVGQKLLLGTVPTPIVTPGPSPTPTSAISTPEPVQGNGTICVYLYNDVNGNAMAEDAEITNTGIGGGEVSITNQEGKYSSVATTLDNGESVCFENIPEGNYTISIAIPDGYNPTSAQNLSVFLKAGDTSHINFSAQVSGHGLTNPQDGGGGSVLLAVIGGIILLAGIGVGIYARHIIKGK
jgi:LysM repeat protein